MKKRFTEEQIIGFLREVDAGMPVKELCRKHGFSEASYYLWRSKFGGMNVPLEGNAACRLTFSNNKVNKRPVIFNHERVARIITFGDAEAFHGLSASQ